MLFRSQPGRTRSIWHKKPYRLITEEYSYVRAAVFCSRVKEERWLFLPLVGLERIATPPPPLLRVSPCVEICIKLSAFPKRVKSVTSTIERPRFGR